MTYNISITYDDKTTEFYEIKGKSLDIVLFSLIVGKSGISTDNVISMSITLLGR